jgi:signal transduction histidine kinase
VERALDVTDLLHAILTCVTAGPGLGFNRAVLFLCNEEMRHLVAAMATGPATAEEAGQAWSRLVAERKSLQDLLQEPVSTAGRTGFAAQVEGLVIPLEDPRTVPEGAGELAQNPILQAYWTRQVVRFSNPNGFDRLPTQLRAAFGSSDVVCAPLVAKDRCVGLLMADNAFSGDAIEDTQLRVLQLLALLGGLALDNARIYRQVEQQTERLRVTLEQLKAAQEELIHSARLAAIGGVVARVSHELRNPLTTIGGFARSLASHPEDDVRVARNAGIIIDEVEKLEELLREMLDFTSPRPPVLALTNLNRAVRAFVRVHEGALMDSGIALDLALDPGLPAVMADHNQLPRVLLNLWQNAVQAMEAAPDGHPRRLTVRTWREGPEVKLAISDSGLGIAPEVRRHIFTPFFTTKQRGTGLGLAVVKKIVDDHHGSIAAHVNDGPGVTFVLSLPVAG